tara:strand:- start:9703 stop:10824 length:1122 start_codon:yes stop_codon:yes gene_type:complete
MKIVICGINGWYIYHFWKEVLIALQEENYRITIIVQKDFYSEELKKLNFEVKNINFFNQSINPLYNIKTLITIYLLYRRIKPDIVHHFNPKPVIFGSLIAKLLNISFIINNYPGLGNLFRQDNIKYRLLSFIIYPLYKFINNNKNIISIFQVSADINFFKKNKLIGSSKSILIQSSGVDLKKFYIKENFNKDSRLNVAMISRLNNDKGLDTYFKIANSYRDKNINFNLAGQIDSKNFKSEKIFYKYAKMNNVKYFGFIDNISNYLKKIDVIILPTRRYEGIPKILIESAASGIVMIASSIGGCKEVIQDEYNGFLINFDNQTFNIIQKINQLDKNRNLLQKMGYNARKSVEEKFDINFIKNSYIDVYKKIKIK